MVKAVRRGASMRAVARRFHVSLRTVRRWVHRTAGQRPDRVNWSDRSHRPHRLQRTPTAGEDVVLALREELRNENDLGSSAPRRSTAPSSSGGTQTSFRSPGAGARAAGPCRRSGPGPIVDPGATSAVAIRRHRPRRASPGGELVKTATTHAEGQGVQEGSVVPYRAKTTGSPTGES